LGTERRQRRSADEYDSFVSMLVVTMKRQELSAIWGLLFVCEIEMYVREQGKVKLSMEEQRLKHGVTRILVLHD